jgi:hypothetical protein
MNIAMFRPATGMHPIAASQLDGLLQIRTDSEDLCFWPCPYGHNEVVFEGFVKCDGGLRHLFHRYETTTIHQATLDALEYGTFSLRPYQLGQACDGSITECALAFFIRWCSDTNRRHDVLYQEAYHREQTPDWKEITAVVEWQGVAYPAEWNAESESGLLASLHEINYHGLAGIASELCQSK